MLSYTPRRLAVMRVLKADVTTGFQTTDGVPTHLTIRGRAVSAATNKVFRDLLSARAISALDDGWVGPTGDGRRARLDWERRYARRDQDDLDNIDLWS